MNDSLHDFDIYQDRARKTAKTASLEYMVLGLANEAGEVAGAMKKYIREDYGFSELQKRMVGELGDVLWYLSMVAERVGIPFSEIAAHNLDKLAKRDAEGKIKGDGDER
jgi:NTP pyrophosphatase (non-canonical NTP hydrolase)